MLVSPVAMTSVGGKLSQFAANAGFKPGAAIVDNMIGGQLTRGGSAFISVDTVKEAVRVTVSFVGKEESVGTLFRLSDGLQKAARAQGATSLRIVAKNVTKELVEYLEKRGFKKLKRRIILRS